MIRSVSGKIIFKNALMIISLIGILTISSLTYLYRLNLETEQIDNRLRLKVETLFEMSQITRDRSFDVYSMFLNDDIWKKDEIFLRYHKRALRFIQLRDKLSKLGLTSAQSAELTKAMDIIKIAQPLQEDIVDKIKEDKKQQVKNMIVEKDIPLESKLFSIFDNLTQLARKEAENAQAKVDQQYISAIYIILLLAICSVMITVFIMRRGMREIHANEMTISWDAEHDHLTNSYNRRWLNKYVKTHGEINDDATRHAVLYIDLDNFKPVNDKYGHNAGDRVLVDMVNIFRNRIRQNDIVVRVGGDEFVILLESCDEAKASEIAIAILEAVSNYQLLFNQKIIAGLSCSIGIGLVSSEIPWEIALQQADEECNRVKHNGKSSLSVYKVAG